MGSKKKQSKKRSATGPPSEDGKTSSESSSSRRKIAIDKQEERDSEQGSLFHSARHMLNSAPLNARSPGVADEVQGRRSRTRGAGQSRKRRSRPGPFQMPLPLVSQTTVFLSALQSRMTRRLEIITSLVTISREADDMMSLDPGSSGAAEERVFRAYQRWCKAGWPSTSGSGGSLPAD
jgi:hypothetical protein